MNESDFRKQVVKLAHRENWKVAFFHRLPTQKGGWRTPVGADGKGWPDLVLVRDRLVFAELKAPKGVLGVEQKDWVNRLAFCGAEVYVWRPQDWPDIERVLADGTGERWKRLTDASGGDTDHADAVSRMIHE